MINRNSSEDGNIFVSQAIRHIVMWAALAAFGCASGDADGESRSTQGDELAQVESRVALLPDAGPRAPYHTEVVANGTGCPPGTWKTATSPDGFQFRTTFSSFEVTVQDGQSVAIKDCNLTVRMHSEVPFSFAVSGLVYSGYAFLESGVRGRQTVKAYFHGVPASMSDEHRTDLTGPVDRKYRFEKIVPAEDLIWAPCGRDRNLQIVTRLVVQKPKNQGAGYLNLSALYYPPDEIAWRVATRPCVEWIMDAGTKMDAGGSPVDPADARP